MREEVAEVSLIHHEDDNYFLKSQNQILQPGRIPGAKTKVSIQRETLDSGLPEAHIIKELELKEIYINRDNSCWWLCNLDPLRYEGRKYCRYTESRNLDQYNKNSDQ